MSLSGQARRRAVHRAGTAALERPARHPVPQLCRLADRVVWRRHEREGVIPAGMRFQSVAVREVAARLVSLVERGPVGRDADMGGPEMLTFDAMAAAYLRIRGSSATIRSANLSGALYVVFRSGVNLTPDHAQGVVTWDAWLRRPIPCSTPWNSAQIDEARAVSRKNISPSKACASPVSHHTAIRACFASLFAVAARSTAAPRLPCDRPRAPLRCSIHAPCPACARRVRLCWRSHVVSAGPSMRSPPPSLALVCHAGTLLCNPPTGSPFCADLRSR